MTKQSLLIFRGFIRDLCRLFFPDLCICCLQPLPDPEGLLCIRCMADLPLTHFHSQKENPVTARFFGRLPLVSGTAFLHFEKKGSVQKLIHALKYDDRPDVGRRMGSMLGDQLSQSLHFHSLDAVVAVPLHPRRQRKRGYNQSVKLAEGIAYALGKPFYENAVIRQKHTTSQTRKSRLERFSNVEKAFQLSGIHDIKNKHILLVDDVLTTGATLEACGAVLLKEEGVKLSIATLAIAEN